MRIDKYFQEKYPNLSRAYIKEQIKRGAVLINKKTVKPSYVLRESDQVAFAPEFASEPEAKIQPNPDIKLHIMYEDNDVIVVDKQAGLSVHPRQLKSGEPIRKEISDTLVSGLLAYYPDIINVGDQNFNPPASLSEGGLTKITLLSERKFSKITSLSKGGLPEITPLPKGGFGGLKNIRPGIVHRLDKDTSGVMIIAKNQKSFDWLKKQFQERKTSKKYVALLNGCPEKNEGEIRTYMARSSSDPSKQKVIPPNQKTLNDKREAVTGYKVIKKFKDFCLIEAYPKTGRLHQIRAQFAWLGCPVAGDKKYGSAKRLMPAGLSRQFLHAQELKIELPNNEKRTFFAPFPADLKSVLAGLEKISE